MKKIFTLHKFFFSSIFFLSVVSAQLVSSTQQTKAADYYWTGAVSNYYNNNLNWEGGSYTSGANPSSLPTSSDNLFIGGASSGNYTILLNIHDTIANLTIEGDGEVFINSSGSGGTLTILGNLTNNNNNAVGGGTCLFKIAGSGSQNISGNSSTYGAGRFPNMTIQKPSGTVTLSNEIVMGGSTSLSLTSGAVDAGSSVVFLSYNNNVRGNWTFSTLQFFGRSGTYNIYDEISTNDISLVGDDPIVVDRNKITVTGNITNGNRNLLSVIHNRIEMNGSDDQTILGDELYLDSLKVNKSSGILILKSSFTINKKLDLTLGIISASSDEPQINLVNGAVCVNASATSFTETKISKTGNSSFNFPVGKNGIYNPLSISAPSSTSDEFVAEYFDETNGVADLVSPLTYADKCEYWYLEEANGTSSVNITLNWNAPCFHIASLSYLKIARDSSSNWVAAGGSTSGNTTTGSITTSTARNDWGNITLGKTNPQITANAGRDTGLCTAHSATIGGSPTASGGTGSKTYAWSPSTGLNNTTVANPVSTPTLNSSYVVEVTDNINEKGWDTIVINGNPIAHAGNDTSICKWANLYIGALVPVTEGTPSFEFSWSPSIDLSDSSIASPAAHPDSTSEYVLTVKDSFSCTSKDTIEISIYSQPIAHAGPDVVFPGTSISIGGSPTKENGTAPYTYSWEPAELVDDSEDSITSVLAAGKLRFWVVDSNGCKNHDDINVFPSTFYMNHSDSSGILILDIDTIQYPASNFLTVHKSDLGLTADDSMILVYSLVDSLTHYSDTTVQILDSRYQQFYNGLKVEDAQLLLHSSDNVLMSLYGLVIPDLDLDVVPDIDTSESLDNALALFPRAAFSWEDSTFESALKEETEDSLATSYPRIKLIIGRPWAESVASSNYRLCYSMNIHLLYPDVIYKVLIDAHDGSVVDIRNMNTTCSPAGGSCTAMYYGYKPLTIQHFGFNYKLRDYCKHVETRWYSDQLNITDNDGNWGTDDQTGTTAHWCALRGWDYWKNTWGDEGADDNLRPLIIGANSSAPTATQRDDDNNQDKIGVGYKSNGNYAATLDIIGHEITHTHIYQTSDFNSVGESGALSEGFADIFGEMAELATQGSITWIHGNPAQDTRSLSNPPSIIQPTFNTGQPDTYNGTFYYNGTVIDDGGIHQNDGVINKWFYLLAVGGTQHGITVSGIGTYAASNIAHRTLTILSPTSGFNDLKSVGIQSAAYLYGTCSNQYLQTVNAFAATVGPFSSALPAVFCVSMVGESVVCTDDPQYPYCYSPSVHYYGPSSSTTYSWSIPSGITYTFTNSTHNQICISHFTGTAPKTICVTVTKNGISHTTCRTVSFFDCDGAPCYQCPVREEGESSSDNSVTIYPNPSNNFIKIVSSETLYGYRIFSLIGSVANSGETFHDESKTEHSVNTSLLTNGIYFIKVKTSSGEKNIKFVVQH